MQWITDPQIWLSLITLTVLEIVLGIDNIIFISILSGKVPREQQDLARTIGLLLALVTRILLLCSIFMLTRLTGPLFAQDGPAPAFIHWLQNVMHHEFSGKDLVMLGGGHFLMWKSVHEIHGSLEGDDHASTPKGASKLSAVIAQIVVIDIVFSLDSVITAVGIGQNIGVMIGAVVLAMIVMLAASRAIGDYVNDHPTIKMLALSFLMLVGVVLIGDGLGQHLSKGYIYFAMAFSFGVEMLNIKMRTKRGVKPVDLRSSY